MAHWSGRLKVRDMNHEEATNAFNMETTSNRPVFLRHKNGNVYSGKITGYKRKLVNGVYYDVEATVVYVAMDGFEGLGLEVPLELKYFEDGVYTVAWGPIGEIPHSFDYMSFDEELIKD